MANNKNETTDKLPQNSPTEGEPTSTKKKISVTSFDDESETTNEEPESTEPENDVSIEESTEESTDDNPDIDDEAVAEPTEEPEETDEPASGLTVGEAIAAADKENETLIDIEDGDATTQADDAAIGALVDDIVKDESTKQLEEADAKLEAANSKPTNEKKSFKAKLASAARTWWHTIWLRNATITVVFVALTVIGLVPVTRYAVLNTIGVRVESRLTVIDSQTRLPLRNIQVELQGQTQDTDKQGEVKFNGLKLGSSQLSITKRGYADNTKPITLGWGSNPIGDQELVATGEQFTFILVDWLSGDRLNDAEAIAGSSSAQSDDGGKIVLTIDQEDIGKDDVVIRTGGYRDQVIESADLVEGDIEIAMVPDTKHAFVSNRDGKFDIYVIDLNGENEELLLEATEKEREVPGIVQHPTDNFFALISSRDGVTNQDNYVLDGLYIVNADNEVERREVQIGTVDDRGVTITSGIDGTERIVARAGSFLTEGRRVSPVRQAAR